MDNSVQQQPVQQPQPVVTQQPATQEPPIVSKHFHFPRVILILLCCLLAALVSGVIFYMVGKAQGQLSITSNPVQTIVKTKSIPPVTIQPPGAQNPSASSTSAQTTNWKNYSDASLHFTLNYPSNWVESANNQDVSSVNGYDFTSPDYTVNSADPVHVVVLTGSKLTILIEANNNFSSYQSYKTFLENASNDSSVSPKAFKNQTDTTVNGVPVLLLTQGSIPGITDAAYAYYNGSTYEMYIQSASNQDNLFTQMVNSFQFPKAK